MAICETPDCGEQSIGYFRNLRINKMVQMCTYCRARCNQTEPRLKPGKLPEPTKKTGAQWVLAGALNRYDWTAEKAFFDTALHGSDGNLEKIWNGRSAYHRTQPRTNLTVVYTRTEQTMTIIGVGHHVGDGNNKYSIRFDDGGTRRCERK
ncbi:MAG: hypothetical protein C9355_10895 [Thalassolituus maritimus]|uniref:Uncharacterized protein n=1 Tax=Thalassolituus maritimus TaxID=484498 RepID=A0A1N7P8X7_9GAMM|nr:hypothetical protein [Thalassolituus maritimus]TPD53962.1 MAG: hypothetical protein C9355_10895 [Thalassolituus maritimus]SIT06987.1 hypothetical protein SAMN05421686_10915 [Thalassolituus maritimus]